MSDDKKDKAESSWMNHILKETNSINEYLEKDRDNVAKSEYKERYESVKEGYKSKHDSDKLTDMACHVVKNTPSGTDKDLITDAVFDALEEKIDEEKKSEPK